MRTTLKPFAAILLISTALVSLKAIAQQSEPEVNATLTSGTLNIVLADKNGFVIATDSRMSSGTRFPCQGRSQLYCDNSQKLFQTSPRSAMAIAGFAVGRWQTPLDLAVAPVLLKALGRNGMSADRLRRVFGELDNDEHSCLLVPQLIGTTLKDALVGMAAINDPRTDPGKLSVTATFACFDRNHIPVVQQMQLAETWTLAGPADSTFRERIPEYSLKPVKPGVRATSFQGVSAGITNVADAILAGTYDSDDLLIQDFYRRRQNHQLDDMTLKDMSALARVFLRETKKFTVYVGGEDQIGEFPSEGSAAFHFPDSLPFETEIIPRLMRWQGLLCTNTQMPTCGRTGVSFSVNPAQQGTHLLKLLLASEFKKVPVALDGNLFVADSFDGVTLKWNGGSFFSYRNTFKDCVLELTLDAQVFAHPELATCRLVRKPVIELPPGTVGMPLQTIPGPSGSFGITSLQP